MAAVPERAGGRRGGRGGRKEPVGPRARTSLPTAGRGATPRGRGGRPGRARASPGEEGAGGPRGQPGARGSARGVRGSPPRRFSSHSLTKEVFPPPINPQRREAPGNTKGPCERNRIFILPLLALGGIFAARGIQTASQAPGLGPSQAWVTWMSGPRALAGLRGAGTPGGPQELETQA